MFYNPPVIYNINDCLPHLEGRKEFIVAERDGYKVIDYTHLEPDSFDNPFRREFRGLKFDEKGKLIARPFHKFFNVNERPETQANNIDFTFPHLITSKLDGSMIHPAVVNDKVVFMTRMGMTDVAMQAYEWTVEHNPNIINVCYQLLNRGFTPIFEFIGPDNRIVVNYERNNLVLLAIRATIMGNYNTYESVYDLAKRVNVDVVAKYSSDVVNYDEFVKMINLFKNTEGVVIQFDGQEMYKVKCDDYVLKHRTKDMIRFDKDRVLLALDGMIDDVIPLIDDEVEATRLRNLESTLYDKMDEIAISINDLVNEAQIKEVDRKTFALEYANKIHKSFRNLAFRAYERLIHRGDLVPYVKDIIKNHCSSSTKLDHIRDVIGM